MASSRMRLYFIFRGRNFRVFYDNCTVLCDQAEFYFPPIPAVVVKTSLVNVTATLWNLASPAPI